MASPLLVLFCFALVFGPKVSVVDFSVLVPALLLPVVSRGPLRMPRMFAGFAYVLVGLISYMALIQLLNQTSGFEPIARLVRALLTVIMLGLLFRSAPRSFGPRIIRAVFLCLVIHAVMIVMAGVLPPLNHLFSMISGNDKVHELRASGLLAGFDIAGLLCLLGLAMPMFLKEIVRSPGWRMLSSSLFLTGCFMSSRVTMAFGGVLFLIYTWQFLKDSSVHRTYRWLLVLVMLGVASVFAYNMVEIFEVTMSLGLLDVDPAIAADILSRHASQHSDQFLWQSHFFLPASNWNLFFGSGIEMLDSDVGYIEEIFRYGLLGLALAIVGHIWFLRQSFKGCPRGSVGRGRGKGLMIFLFALMLLLTLKNNYIWVRSVFPVFLMLGAALPLAAQRPAGA